MGIADAVKPVKEVVLTELATAFLDNFHVVSWGTPGAEAADKIEVTLQIKNPLEDDLVCVERLRLTCSAGGTMSLVAAGNGVVLDGDGTDDMIIETDAVTGSFDLEVSNVAATTITVVAGVTQGSGVCACDLTVDLVFA